METVREGFQVFAKPVGSSCNLSCLYCYYLKNTTLYPGIQAARMPDKVLEAFIRQMIEASSEKDIFFSWHGGEPTLAGIGFYRKIIEIQKRLKPAGKEITNGIQTNGTLLTDEWAHFLAENRFVAGISMDGPPPLHDQFRLTIQGQPTHSHAISGYNLLQKWGIPCEVLCVVNAINVHFPLEVYRYFRNIGARFITFLPLVEQQEGEPGRATAISVPPREFGRFLSIIFDEWATHDIGKIKIQVFEEALRTAFNQEHSLCIFKKTCGRVPTVEINGDFYSCDHFTDKAHLIGNILDTPLSELLESPPQTEFGRNKQTSLPDYCIKCSVKDMCNGECPRNRFLTTPDGKPGLNYLCEGYQAFFTHCKPFVKQVATLWKSGNF